MTDDDAPRPRMLAGLSHRHGDGLTLDQMRALEAAERDREAALNAPPPGPPPKPLGELVTIGGKPPPPYRPPKRDPRPPPRRISMNAAAFDTLTALTAEERGLLRELRAVDPSAAGQALLRIKEAQRRKTEKQTRPSDAYARRPWPSVEHRDPTRY
jgi:hypothetical protein